MKKEIKEQWVKALRSGEYKQGRHYLFREKEDEEGLGFTYCCLGVLCDLHRKENDGKLEETASEGRVYLGRSDYPSIEVQDWAGLDQGNIYVNFDEQQRSLASLNDNRGLTFDEIADLVEDQL